MAARRKPHKRTSLSRVTCQAVRTVIEDIDRYMDNASHDVSPEFDLAQDLRAMYQDCERLTTNKRHRMAWLGEAPYTFDR